MLAEVDDDDDDPCVDCLSAALPFVPDELLRVWPICEDFDAAPYDVPARAEPPW